MVEVPPPAAARAVAGDALAQPVPLHRAHRGFRVQDQARELLTASLVIGGLIPGQAGTARDVTMLDVAGPAARRAVSDLPPALRASPGQRRIAALAAGELPGRVLSGGEQQLRAGFAGDPVDHPAQVLISADAASVGVLVDPSDVCLPDPCQGCIGRSPA